MEGNGSTLHAVWSKLHSSLLLPNENDPRSFSQLSFTQKYQTIDHLLYFSIQWTESLVTSLRNSMLSRIPLPSRNVKFGGRWSIILLPLGASLNCYVYEIIYKGPHRQVQLRIKARFCYLKRALLILGQPARESILDFTHHSPPQPYRPAIVSN